MKDLSIIPNLSLISHSVYYWKSWIWIRIVYFGEQFSAVTIYPVSLHQGGRYPPIIGVIDTRYISGVHKWNSGEVLNVVEGNEEKSFVWKKSSLIYQSSFTDLINSPL